MDLSPLVEYCEDKGFPLDQEAQGQFTDYLERLYQLNAVSNLTRVAKGDAVVRHCIDSLLVAEFLPIGASVLDVGTGPGFPAWPLACARRDLHVTAMDSSGKMQRALGGVALPNLVTRLRRAEEVDARESFDVVTGRAVAPLSVQLEVSAAWCKVGGLVVPFRTSSEGEEIERFPAKVLGLRLRSIESQLLPGTDAVRLFPIFEKVSTTPAAYPRTWAQIKSSPIG